MPGFFNKTNVYSKTQYQNWFGHIEANIQTILRGFLEDSLLEAFKATDEEKEYLKSVQNQYKKCLRLYNKLLKMAQFEQFVELGKKKEYISDSLKSLQDEYKQLTKIEFDKETDRMKRRELAKARSNEIANIISNLRNPYSTNATEIAQKNIRENYDFLQLYHEVSKLSSIIQDKPEIQYQILFKYTEGKNDSKIGLFKGTFEQAVDLGLIQANIHKKEDEKYLSIDFSSKQIHGTDLTYYMKRSGANANSITKDLMQGKDYDKILAQGIVDFSEGGPAIRRYLYLYNWIFNRAESSSTRKTYTAGHYFETYELLSLMYGAKEQSINKIIKAYQDAKGNDNWIKGGDIGNDQFKARNGNPYDEFSILSMVTQYLDDVQMYISEIHYELKSRGETPTESKLKTWQSSATIERWTQKGAQECQHTLEKEVEERIRQAFGDGRFDDIFSKKP